MSLLSSISILRKVNTQSLLPVLETRLQGILEWDKNEFTSKTKFYVGSQLILNHEKKQNLKPRVADVNIQGFLIQVSLDSTWIIEIRGSNVVAWLKLGNTSCLCLHLLGKMNYTSKTCIWFTRKSRPTS